MLKIDKAQPSHRNSVSIVSAAGSNAHGSSWSTKDDEVLIQARAHHPSWSTKDDEVLIQARAHHPSWSTKDDEVLIQARTQGLNWNQIAPNHFPSKSPNACRKRHERLTERQNAEQWDGVNLDVLAQAYMDCRREMWSILAARLGAKWTIIEQKVSSLLQLAPLD
jgi:hypothetical protein